MRDSKCIAQASWRILFAFSTTLAQSIAFEKEFCHRSSAAIIIINLPNVLISLPPATALCGTIWGLRNFMPRRNCVCIYVYIYKLLNTDDIQISKKTNKQKTTMSDYYCADTPDSWFYILLSVSSQHYYSPFHDSSNLGLDLLQPNDENHNPWAVEETKLRWSCCSVKI